jgi:hypothetical protein
LVKSIRYHHLYRSYRTVTRFHALGGRFFGFLNRLLDRYSIVLCKGTNTQEEEYASEVIEVDMITIADLIHEQLAWAKRFNYHPTKLILGRDQYEKLRVEDRGYQLSFYSTHFPPGTAVFAGLELVINPMIDGAVIG